MWETLGAALLGVMLAKWTWLLLAPLGMVMPPAVWEASGDSARVFGSVREPTAAAALALGNVRLIGVFASRTKGFAVMQVDGKQIGVAQGEDVKPGVRLVETFPDYVILEQGGVRQQVDLSGASGSVTPSPAAPSPVAIDSHPATTAPGQIEAWQQRLNTAGNALPPDRQKMLQRQIDGMRAKH